MGGVNSVIPALGRWTQEDLEFKDSLGYIVTPCPKKKKKKQLKQNCFLQILNPGACPWAQFETRSPNIQSPAPGSSQGCRLQQSHEVQCCPIKIPVEVFHLRS
jgi:hypothetical protein